MDSISSRIYPCSKVGMANLDNLQDAYEIAESLLDIILSPKVHLGIMQLTLLPRIMELRVVTDTMEIQKPIKIHTGHKK